MGSESLADRLREPTMRGAECPAGCGGVWSLPKTGPPVCIRPHARDCPNLGKLPANGEEAARG